MAKGETTIEFADCSGGMNSTDPSNTLRENQCQYARNVFLLKKGWKRIPGYAGLSATRTLASPSRLLDFYKRTDGSDTAVTVGNGKAYLMNKATNVATEIYTLNGTGEAYGDNYQDRYFLANGRGCMKIEGTTGYKLGIDPPTDAVAELAAGGSLADGAYAVYVSYARGNLLYSYAQSLGTFTCGGGLNTIKITLPNSTDAQVTNKVVWMQGPSESLIYFYGQTNNNTTVSISITSVADEDTTKLYRILGEQSVAPPNLEGIHVHNQSLYGWIENVLHKSLPATTIYDLDRWPDITYTFPFKILGLFTVDDHLYINTVGGVYRLPYGDMNAEFSRVTERLFFKYMRSVARNEDNGGYVIGLTNDGVRIFDGEKFSIDLSKDMKPYIDYIHAGVSEGNQPCGIIYNRDFRTEYRLSYLNLNVGVACNNQQMVLNLDTLSWNNNNDYNAAWELVDIGFTYAAVDGSGTLYLLQSTNGGSQMLKESTTVTTDINFYNTSGVFVTTATAKVKDVKSRVIAKDIAYMLDFPGLWVYRKQTAVATVYVYAADYSSVDDSVSIAATTENTSTFGTAIFGTATFQSVVPKVIRCAISEDVKGSAFYFRFYQTADDSDMQVFEVKAIATAEAGRHI